MAQSTTLSNSYTTTDKTVSTTFTSENFMIESVAIALGVLTFAIFLGLIGYILHIKERQRNARQWQREVNDANPNDYASINRMNGSTPYSMPSDSIIHSDLGICSTDVYVQLDETQMIDVEMRHIQSLNSAYQKEQDTNNVYLWGSTEGHKLTSSRDQSDYITAVSDSTISSMLDQHTDNNGYLTVVNCSENSKQCHNPPLQDNSKSNSV